MKLKEVEIGRTYTARVSGKLVPVRVTGRREVYNGRTMRWVFDATNETTGRAIVIRSPQRLRVRLPAAPAATENQ